MSTPKISKCACSLKMSSCHLTLGHSLLGTILRTLHTHYTYSMLPMSIVPVSFSRVAVVQISRICMSISRCMDQGFYTSTYTERKWLKEKHKKNKNWSHAIFGPAVTLSRRPFSFSFFRIALVSPQTRGLLTQDVCVPNTYVFTGETFSHPLVIHRRRPRHFEYASPITLQLRD